MATTTFIPGNNINTALAAATPSTGGGSTTIVLASSANLPTLTGGQQMPLTLNDAATGSIYEVVYVTAITGATLTVIRAQEGTTAQNWSIGDFAFCAPTEGTVAQINGNPAQQFQVAPSTAANQAPQTGQLQTGSVSYAVATGTANAHTIALTPALTARTDGMLLRYKAPAANTSAVTLTDGVGTVAVIGSGHAPLQGGEYIANGDALVVWNSTINSGTYILLECTGGALQVSPATQSQHAVQLQQVGHGQCRLSVASTTSLKLSPYNGNNVIVNGVPVAIPSAGLTIANTSLSASTVYYVYLTGTPAAPALALSTTGHVTGANGVEVKNGDATQTLVGMISTNASSQFVDSATQRFCLNWFNRRNLLCNGTFGPNTTTSVSATELSTANRLFFLSWSDESFRAVYTGNATSTIGSGAGSLTQVSLDGTSFGTNFVSASVVASSAVGFNTEYVTTPSEGTHFVTVYGAIVASGSSAFQGNSTNQLCG